jgi:hypothetical protein
MGYGCLKEQAELKSQMKVKSKWAIHAQWGVKVEFDTFLTLLLHYQANSLWCPLNRRLGGPKNWSECFEN